MALNDSIVKLNTSRKNLSMELLGKDGCMSDFISFAEANQPDQKEALLLRKVKICNIFEGLALLNNQNMELIKHGIVITNKMLETVINAFAPLWKLNVLIAGAKNTNVLTLAAREVIPHEIYAVERKSTALFCPRTEAGRTLYYVFRLGTS